MMLIFHQQDFFHYKELYFPAKCISLTGQNVLSAPELQFILQGIIDIKFRLLNSERYVY